MARREELLCLERLRAILRRPWETVVFDNSNGFVAKMLEGVRPNPNENSFPDFLFEGGAMEHFLIGSSRETRKGSEFKRERFVNEQKSAVYLENETLSFLGSEPRPGTYSVASTKTIYRGFSYDDFLISLEKNVSSHVDSLRGTVESFESVVFLMEQQTAKLNIYQDGHFSRFYKLSEDKKALAILAKYADSIDYVVYFVVDCVEIIDLNKLPQMIGTAHSDLDVRGGRFVEVHNLLTIDLP